MPLIISQDHSLTFCTFQEEEKKDIPRENSAQEISDLVRQQTIRLKEILSDLNPVLMSELTID